MVNDMTVREAASRLRFNHGTVRRLINWGVLREAGRDLVDGRDIERFLQGERESLARLDAAAKSRG